MGADNDASRKRHDLLDMAINYKVVLLRFGSNTWQVLGNSFAQLTCETSCDDGKEQALSTVLAADAICPEV